MNDRIKWSADFKEESHKEQGKGLRGIAKSILHLFFVLCALCTLAVVYTLFEKTELNPATVKSPEVGTKPVEAGALDSLSELNVEDRFQEEDWIERISTKP